MFAIVNCVSSLVQVQVLPLVLDSALVLLLMKRKAGEAFPDYEVWSAHVVETSTRAYYSQRKEKWFRALYERVSGCATHPDSLVFVQEVTKNNDLTATSDEFFGFWTKNPKEAADSFEAFCEALNHIKKEKCQDPGLTSQNPNQNFFTKWCATATPDVTETSSGSGSSKSHPTVGANIKQEPATDAASSTKVNVKAEPVKPSCASPVQTKHAPQAAGEAAEDTQPVSEAAAAAEAAEDAQPDPAAAVAEAAEDTRPEPEAAAAAEAAEDAQPDPAAAVAEAAEDTRPEPEAAAAAEAAEDPKLDPAAADEKPASPVKALPQEEVEDPIPVDATQSELENGLIDTPAQVSESQEQAVSNDFASALSGAVCAIQLGVSVEDAVAMVYEPIQLPTPMDVSSDTEQNTFVDRPMSAPRFSVVLVCFCFPVRKITHHMLLTDTTLGTGIGLSAKETQLNKKKKENMLVLVNACRKLAPTPMPQQMTHQLMTHQLMTHQLMTHQLMTHQLMPMASSIFMKSRLIRKVAVLPKKRQKLWPRPKSCTRILSACMILQPKRFDGNRQ